MTPTPASDSFADLGALARQAERFGLIWSGGGSDLNTNLLLFAEGEGVSEHVNSEVDVLIVGILGEGALTIDGVRHALAEGQTLIVPKGTSRSITSMSDRFAYFTCHQRRSLLWPTVPDSGDRITSSDRDVRPCGEVEEVMAGFSTNIERDSLANDYFRKVIFTAPGLQLVLMTLQPGEEIGLETHEHGDQFFRIESGTGKALIGGESHDLSDGISIVIPAGEEHNVINSSKSEPLRMYTIYTPPEHADGTIHKTKAEADAAEHDH